jgi:autotransporter-associated beta strand protein
MYTYSQIHVDNTFGGGGSSPADALYVAYTQGNDTMSHYTPTDTADFRTTPDASERASAANYKALPPPAALWAHTNGSGEGVIAEDLIKNALAGNQPVALGMHLRDGFYAMNNPGIFYDTDVTTSYLDRVTGKERNHEVLALGYDQAGVWIQNSWGTGFGQGGFAELSWQVIDTDVYDARTMSGFAAGSTADTTPPSVTAPVETIVGGTVGTGVPVKVSWSATDASGIASYELWVSTNGGAWVQDTSVPVSATSKTYTAMAVGKSYRFFVRAYDNAGNASSDSAAAYGPVFTPTVIDDRSTAISYVGVTGASRTWAHTSWASAYIGTLTVSTPLTGAGNSLVIGGGGSGGTVVLTSTSNTFGGATTITLGTLQVGANNALPTSTSVAVAWCNWCCLSTAVRSRSQRMSPLKTIVSPSSRASAFL